MEVPNKTSTAKPSSTGRPHTVSDRLMSNLSYRRAIEQLHGLGPRAVGELISDLAQHEGCDGAVLDLLYRYGRLSPEMVRTIAAGRKPPNSFHGVPEAG